jgi:phenylalanyl-tRNA synthetase beta chain
MKFTLSWLKDHLDTEATLDQIVETLTRIGLEVEGVEDPAKKLAGFSIAYVLEAKQHPNADRLRVCMVETGHGAPVQVVCGAPNARTGMKSVFSPPGTYIPGKDITLGKGVIRGVESGGMLCSAAELKLSEDHDGILDLPEEAPVGMAYAEYLGLADPVIEINLTPNRPDATGVYGIARDLAAAGLGTLKVPKPLTIKGDVPCPVAVSLEFAEADRHLCPAFALRLVRGVKNGPSPDWMQAKLKAIGLRPINALVDITNFMTFDQGRPLHVFDAAKVHGNLVVRRAKAGETLLALDGKTYALEPGMVAIADDNGVESLAGIMGGEVSGCDENTTDVLIESALWDPNTVARTGRALGINSDARYRFERGIDPAYTVPGLDRATELVLQLCGGTATEVTLAGKVPDGEKVVDFPWNETKRLTGLDVPRADAKVILHNLGFWVSGNSDFARVAVPSWRPDVEGKADLVEEIVRIYGIDSVPMIPLQRENKVHSPVLTLIQKRTRLSRRLLAGRGMTEALTWSFVSKAEAEMFGGGDPVLALANPVASELSDMRPTLLIGLIKSAQRNADRGYGDTALFEVGQIFRGDTPEDQKTAASGIRRGIARPGGVGRHWSGSGPANLFDVKADALAVLAACGAPMAGVQIQPGGPAWFHPGRSATLQMGREIYGWFGEVHPRAAEFLGADGPLYAFEIILDSIPAPKAKATKVKPRLDLAELQPVARDFAFMVDSGMRAEDLLKVARGIDKTLVSGVSLFDVYEGKGVEPGKKSIAIEVKLQPRDKTLTDADIEAFSAKLVAEMEKKTGASLRS